MHFVEGKHAALEISAAWTGERGYFQIYEEANIKTKITISLKFLRFLKI
jgi:hypothetical protein